MRFDLGNVYDFYQHDDCAVIYIGEKEIIVNMCSDSIPKKILKKEACIIYNKEKKVKSWGDLYFQYHDQDYICINNFIEKLYQLFQRDQSTWDQDDIFLIQAVSELIRLTVQEAMKLPGIAIEHTDALHYAFVVPSHWQENVAKDLVWSVFSQACLISAQDHKDRVLLCPEVESIFYLLGHSKKISFRTGQDSILSRLSAVEQDTVLVKLDLVSTVNTLFDSKNSLMVPKVLKSIDLSFTYQDIKNCIKEFFKSLLFDGIDGAGQDSLLDEIAEFKINIGLLKPNTLDRFEYDGNPSYEKYMYDRVGLTEVQKAIVRSIRPIDLCDSMSKTLFVKMMDLLSNYSEKEYKLLVLQDSYSYRVSYNHFALDRRSSLLGWIYIMMEYNRQSLSSTAVIEPSVDIDPVSLECIVSGARFAVMEIVKNSNKYRNPHIVESKDLSASSSIFLNSEPDNIVNIDISRKSTVLSYSFMNDDGIIEKTFNHDYFTNDKALVSLGLFFDISEKTTLNIEEKFISFVYKYFSDTGCFSGNKEKTLLQFETILSDTLSTDKVLLSTTEKKYIKAFMFMYFVYIRTLLLSKSPIQAKPDDVDINVGYAVSMENALLEKTIGSIEDLKDIVFASGLVQKNESSKRLIITTQEEELMPKIQKTFGLHFPVRSYFVVAQLYQDYIQLTLRQTVTKLNEEEEGQESIVIQEKMVQIPDVYNEINLIMQKKITENKDLIQLCHLHDHINDNQISEMVSSNIKTGFSRNFKQFISNKIFGQSSDLETSDDNTIPLSDSCNCNVCLTVNEIADFSIKPVLSKIFRVLSDLIVNKALFKKYTDIKYIFGLIYFNDNSQLQSTIVGALQEQVDQFNQTVDTSFFIVPDLPRLLLQPAIKQQSLLYKTFQVGRLYQVYTGSYVISVVYTGLQKLNISFSNQKMDEESNETDTCTAFLLIKKGEKISNTRLEKIFYFKTDKDVFPDRINLAIHKIKLADDLEYEKFDLRGAQLESIFNTEFYFRQEEYKAHSNIPVAISIENQVYSSSIKFLIKIHGKSVRPNHCPEIAEPLTLMRF